MIVGRLAQVNHVPSICLEALADVVARRELRRPVDRDVVVVEDVDQPAEPEVTGERSRFVADALHEVAVAAKGKRVMVTDPGAELVPEETLSEREPDTLREALPKRPGRHLDARRVVNLRVPRCARAELAELPKILELEAVAGEIEHRVLEDGGVPVREHETITVGPLRLRGFVTHHSREEHVGKRREGHRRARVAGVRPLRAVHGEPTDDVDAALLELSVAPRGRKLRV